MTQGLLPMGEGSRLHPVCARGKFSPLNAYYPGGKEGDCLEFVPEGKQFVPGRGKV